MGNNKYFIYDAIKNNCQVFIKSIVKSLGNNSYTSNIDSFIMQDVENLLSDSQNKLVKNITNLGGYFDTLVLNNFFDFQLNPIHHLNLRIDH